MVFGFVLLARPMIGALGVIWLIGTFSIVLGIVLILLSLKLRGLRKKVGEAVARIADARKP